MNVPQTFSFIGSCFMSLPQTWWPLNVKFPCKKKKLKDFFFSIENVIKRFRRNGKFPKLWKRIRRSRPWFIFSFLLWVSIATVDRSPVSDIGSGSWQPGAEGSFTATRSRRSGIQEAGGQIAVGKQRHVRPARTAAPPLRQVSGRHRQSRRPSSHFTKSKKHFQLKLTAC